VSSEIVVDLEGIRSLAPQRGRSRCREMPPSGGLHNAIMFKNFLMA
jgi:hypothetical protein